MKKQKLTKVHLNLPLIAKRFLAINGINAGVLARSLTCDFFLKEKKITESCWQGPASSMTKNENNEYIYKDWSLQKDLYVNTAYENLLLNVPKRKPGNYKGVLTVSIYPRMIPYFKINNIDMNEFIKTLVLKHLEKEYYINPICWTKNIETPIHEFRIETKSFLFFKGFRFQNNEITI